MYSLIIKIGPGMIKFGARRRLDREHGFAHDQPTRCDESIARPDVTAGDDGLQIATRQHCFLLSERCHNERVSLTDTDQSGRGLCRSLITRSLGPAKVHASRSRGRRDGSQVDLGSHGPVPLETQVRFEENKTSLKDLITVMEFALTDLGALSDPRALRSKP